MILSDRHDITPQVLLARNELLREERDRLSRLWQMAIKEIAVLREHIQRNGQDVPCGQ